ncbi:MULTISPECIES: 23S rRNA (adenine(2503)-C(2))-methyltransferase RlmN [Bacillus]|uniref:Probable dual-specificity RNA methyltransferase RlmN n=2 Tax=Bacillus cereus group TaxID=86661 RepID=A0A2C1E4M7_BACCE|nr:MULTISPECIES: 23S rRNA (adenine(2503)-C(2))-methyltransferase RlmN [Bacillus cereus group]MBJ8051275.1 23S rRNA (adenine(2503)-C(2))-methyltransferase RlmN [Bacillus cereus]OFD73734.1 23S rRNA (adenine(2503)-C(2))-methyltransferase RlmN [Bacillus mycoides]OFD74141.1 23S rRNA (adenine(2503)-C(2))-methyltransferase RlmN [Bacillus mycoides]OFD76766.1 23S rRNA (adenine(2503)-C(2))-methyltransferase RlmN [Bacillus mycoides]PGT07034.1 23S rRNA (adenine(2503)-C(2))-methyltransferase RlmN [Bacillus
METTVKKQKKNLETKKPSIYSLQLHEMQDWLKEQGEPKFRAGQIFDWLYKKRVKNYEDMSNLAKGLRDKLSNSFDITTLNTLVKQTSSDGTIKFLFQLYDGYSIETVLMRHEYGNSICVTTQVGCRIGCTFCASTLGGLKRNLEAGEIVAQVVEVQRALDETEERVSSLVVMGIGEPFDNYDNLMSFLRIVNHEKGIHIGARHMTVSTSGIVPKIYKFAEEDMQINFAISLHSANTELRSKLMPINRAYKLPDLMEAVKYYVNRTGRRITFEYGLFGGENDQVEQAEELAALLKGVKCHVNLIPVNYVPERDYVRTPREQIFLFEKTLKDRGVNVTIRREQGHDIDAACGQLRAKERKEETR